MLLLFVLMTVNTDSESVMSCVQSGTKRERKSNFLSSL